MLDAIRSYVCDPKPCRKQLKDLFKHCPVFLSLLIINALVFTAECLWPERMSHLFLWHNSFTETGGLTFVALVQMFTSMFCHANFGHIFGNFFFGAPFALYLEKRIGSLSFLKWWLICGMGGAFVWVYSPHLLPWNASLGASGAICGVMVGACLLQDKSNKCFRVLGVVAAGLFFWLQFCNSIAGMGLVASADHVGGMIAAFLLVSQHLISKCKP